MASTLDLDSLLAIQDEDEDDGGSNRSLEAILLDLQEDEDEDEDEAEDEAALVLPPPRLQEPKTELPLQGQQKENSHMDEAKKGSRSHMDDLRGEVFPAAPWKPILPRVTKPGDAVAAASAASRQVSIAPPSPPLQESPLDGTDLLEHTAVLDDVVASADISLSHIFPEPEAIDSTEIAEGTAQAQSPHVLSSSPPKEVLLNENHADPVASPHLVQVIDPSEGVSESSCSEDNQSYDGKTDDIPPDQIENLIDTLKTPSSSSDGIESNELNRVGIGREAEKKDGEQSESKKGNVVVSGMTALEQAEEKEKRAASSGFHLEEGAAAQPMRLEGIQRGPPAIGLMQMETVEYNPQIFNSTTLHDHGNPEALAVHSNHIAVGMSKGSVFVIPSKNFATPTDNTEMKIAYLSGNALDKSLVSAASSMGFNIQGDMLLVGHTSGALVLWDVIRATVLKVILEHNAAILCSFFLGQDSHMGKQIKAVSLDCKGMLLLHTFTVVPLLRRFSVTSQCLLDGQRTGKVLCMSPLPFEEIQEGAGGSASLQSSPATFSQASLGSMMGSMMGGVVSGTMVDSSQKSLYDGSSLEEAAGVVVFVTQQALLVVRLIPSLKLFAKMARPDGIREGAVPYTAWRRMQASPGFLHGSRNDPVRKEGLSRSTSDSALEEESINLPTLVLAWDRKAFIIQLAKDELKVVTSWELDSAACGVAWLEEQMVVVLTSKGHLCLLTREGIELERSTISSENSSIVYHAHITNSFGNPERAYHSSIAACGPCLYLLGSVKLWRARLLHWHERIQALKHAGDWMGAFHMAMEVYDGNMHGVTGLPKGLLPMQQVVLPNLLDLLFSYIDEAFAYLSLGYGSPMLSAQDSVSSLQDATGEAQEQYGRVGGVAIEFCVHIGKTDVLFDTVFGKFAAVGQQGTFLELLEPYILKDMLRGLAPEIMQALVEHYSSKGLLQRVEQCVLHMDIASLDFNQVVRLCREHGLYSALIYVFNKGLDDFKLPLEELLAVAEQSNISDAKALGYKMMVYLKYCFSGQAFPPGHGLLPAERLCSLKIELLQFLLDGNRGGGNFSRVNQETGESTKIRALPHPRLCYLLGLDTKAALEVLGCAFSQSEAGGSGRRDSVMTLQNGAFDFGAVELGLAQEVVSALVDIIDCFGNSSNPGGNHSPSLENCYDSGWPKDTIGLLFNFIAHYVALGAAHVSVNMLTQIVEHLTSGCAFETVDSNESKKREREKLLVKLLKGPSGSEVDLLHTLELTLQSHFWQASALLYERAGNFLAALDTYMKDEACPLKTFIFTLDVLSRSDKLEIALISEFRSIILSYIPKFLQINSEATLIVVLKHFGQEQKQILEELEVFPELLFHYLKTLMNSRSQSFESSSVLDTGINGICALDAFKEETAEDESELSKELFVLLYDNGSLRRLINSSGMEISDEIAERYVELLCKFEPNSVLKFLESYENYRLEHCLKLCQEYGIVDAAAFLLERVGDVGSALSLVLADMDAHIYRMDYAVAKLYLKAALIDVDMKDTENFLRIVEVGALYAVMKVAIGLCQRNTFRLDPTESEYLWFRLLDRFVQPLHNLYEDSIYSQQRKQFRKTVHDDQRVELRHSESTSKWKVLKASPVATEVMRRILVYFMSRIVNGMMGYIPLPVMMGKLLMDNGSYEFGDFKSVVLEMLRSYSYELAILSTARRLIDNDAFHNISILKKSFSHGCVPSDLKCCICNHGLDRVDWLSAGNRLDVAHDSMKVKKSNDPAKSSEGSKTRLSRSPLGSGSDYIQIFFCGHVAHSTCISRESEEERTSVHSRRNNITGCPLCEPNILLSSPNKGKLEVNMDGNFVSSRQEEKNNFSSGSENLTGTTLLSTKPFHSRFELLKEIEKGVSLYELETGHQLPLVTPALPSSNVSKNSHLLHSLIGNKGSLRSSKRPQKLR